MLRKVKLFLIMLLLAAFVLPYQAYAMTELAEPELTIYCQADGENLVGVEFELYRVADLAYNGEFRVTDRFFDFEYDVKNITDPRKLAVELEYCVLDFDLKPDATCITDEDGIAKLPEEGKTLERGLYLVLGRQHVQSGYVYNMDPMLVSLPRYDEAAKEFSYQCLIKPKYDRDSISEDNEINRKVLKIWQDTGYESLRPTQITVKLLKNRKVYDTVILSKDNNWSHTWRNLSADEEWTVLEEHLDDYRTSVTLEGITFKLTNTFVPPLEPPPDEPPGELPPDEPPLEPPPPENPPELPQTGQLWWPVPILFLVGIIFVAIGLMHRREEYYED